jgi:hypothetical protein
VIFGNNFRESSIYAFYSGQSGLALFSGENRKSQYDLWHYEDGLQYKNIYLFKKDSFPGSMPFHYVDVMIENPCKQPLTFNNNISGMQTILFCRINGQNKIIDFDLIAFASSNTMPGGSTKTIAVNIETATPDHGKYNASFGFRNPPLQDSFNSVYDFTVK